MSQTTAQKVKIHFRSTSKDTYFAFLSKADQVICSARYKWPSVAGKKNDVLFSEEQENSYTDQLLSMVLWSFFLEKYFEAIRAKELRFKQGECELEDLTYRLKVL